MPVRYPLLVGSQCSTTRHPAPGAATDCRTPPQESEAMRVRRTKSVVIAEGSLDADPRRLDRLHRSAFPRQPNGHRPMGESAIPHSHARRTGRLSVARRGRRLIGYALAAPALGEEDESGHWHLEAIAVHPGEQSKGLGADLLNHVAGLVRSAGGASLDASPLVGEAEERRRRWMIANGFEPLEGRIHRLDLAARRSKPPPNLRAPSSEGDGGGKARAYDDDGRGSRRQQGM